MNNEPKQNDPKWIQELGTSPFSKDHFTPEMKNSVLHRYMFSSQPSRRKKKHMIRATVTGIGALAILGILLVFMPSLFDNNHSNPEQQPSAITGSWAPHSEFLTADGSLKLQAFPGGDYQAGTPAGSAWFLHVPITKLEGQSIQITAIHKDTGMEIEELPKTTITSDMAYDDSTRITTSFSLPLSGLWKFDVYIGEEKFGDIVIDVPDSSWEPSPTFRSGNYKMTGVENRLGFINPGFIAGQSNKYMWHFWGSAAELNGDLRIVAVKQHSTELTNVALGKIRTGELNKADAAIPTSMSLPTPGLWRLMVFIDERLFGSVIVEVE